MRHLLTIFSLVSLCSCALHLRAPDLDVGAVRPVAPASEVSHLAAVVRLPLPVVAALVDQHVTEPIERTENVGPLTWTLHVTRQGQITARAENETLCFDVPFRGTGTVTALGARLERRLDARIGLCAVPHLGPRGVLTLRDVTVRVQVAHSDLGALTRPLFDGLAAQLEHVAGTQLIEYLKTLEIPAGEAWAPLIAMLAHDVAMPGGGCLRLRAQTLELGQPDVDPNALRLSVHVTALPTMEQPCAHAMAPTLPSVTVTVAQDLQHPQTRLLLPVGIGLGILGDEVGKALRALGRIETEDGWLEVQGVRLDTAGHALVLRAQVRGEVRDTLFWIPYRRAVDGEVLLWGVPQLDATSVRLASVQLDLRTADGLTQLGAALKRARLTETVEKKLQVSRYFLENQARAALLDVGKGLELAGHHIPVRIDTETLQLETARALAGRLEVQVRFVGQIVIGDTNRL